MLKNYSLLYHLEPDRKLANKATNNKLSNCYDGEQTPHEVWYSYRQLPGIAVVSMII